MTATMNTDGLELLIRRAGGREERADEVRAMPVILRIERNPPPGRTPLLEAAAAAAVAVCLDDRAAAQGPWHDRMSAWLGMRIRKVARRSRGIRWDAVQNLDGVTAGVGGAQARALVPDLVSRVPPEVRRLQISGTELEPDDPGAPDAELPLLWLNPTAPMTLGKAAAQVGHASMLLAAELHAAGEDDTLAAWARDGFRCAVRTPSPARWESDLAAPGAVPVRDAGFTEVVPGTVTVVALRPGSSSTT